MDFPTAEKERERLRSQQAAGQITGEAYAAAVSALRVTDAQGRWWQPDPAGPGWLFWNGSAWVPAAPPSGSGGLQAGTPKSFVEFQSRLMTVDEFKKMSKEVPLAKRPQKWWDLLSILGGIASACLWLVYSGIREGFDFFTPILMVAIPVFMIWFREDLDVALLGIQPYRKDVNKFLLVGIGMAFPFLTAFVLFNMGIRNYPLIQWNMIIGTFGAYAITRTPVISMPGTGSQPGAGQRPIPAAHGFLLLLAAAIGSFLIFPVRADDCTSDILNAQDCLRTEGYAEGISGGFSTLISTSVNGPTVVQTLSGGGTQTPQQPSTPADQSGTAGQTTGQQPSTPGDQSGTAGQTTGQQPSTPGDQSGTAGQTTGQQPSTPGDQSGTAGQTTGQQPSTPGDQSGTAGQTTGQQPSTPADQSGTAGQTTGQQPSTPADQSGTAGQTTGQQPSTPADHAGTAGQTTGQQPSTPAGPAAQADGPDGLPFNPDDAQNVKEAIDETRHEREVAAAAAAAAAAAQAAAAVKPPVPPGIDPNTGKRILTPEQQARREELIREIAKNQAEAEEWSSYAGKLDTAVTVLETVEKTADIAIDVGATLSPGAGAKIKNIYGATKTIAKNMSQSYADGKGLGQGFKDGVIEAATDKALDTFAGKVTDKFNGKIPGFGKFDTHAEDYGKMPLSQIKERLGSAFVKETGDIGQDLRHIIQQGDAKRAVSNAVKNAVQGQAQSASLWDPFKKFFGVSK
jgi:hypothetical protein